MSDTTNYCMECERLARERDALFLERQDEADRAECAEAERDNLRKRADYLNNAFNKKCDELFGLKSVIRAAGCTCNDYAAISPHACDCPLPELALDAAEHAVIKHMLAATQRDAAELRAELDRLHNANNVLINAIKDLDGDYDGKTCPRVQCRGALKRAEADIEALLAVREQWRERAERAEAELERMRPIVEAACGWRDRGVSGWTELDRAIARAVDAYRAETSEQANGHTSTEQRSHDTTN